MCVCLYFFAPSARRQSPFFGFQCSGGSRGCRHRHRHHPYTFRTAIINCFSCILLPIYIPYYSYSYCFLSTTTAADFNCSYIVALLRRGRDRRVTPEPSSPSKSRPLSILRRTTEQCPSRSDSIILFAVPHRQRQTPTDVV